MGKNSGTTYSKSKKLVRSYQTSQLFFDLCQVTNTKLKFFQAIVLKFKTCMNRRVSMKTKCLWPNSKRLIVLRQKNKIMCYVRSYHFKTYRNFELIVFIDFRIFGICHFWRKDIFFDKILYFISLLYCF